jgi:subtilisin family serine protease
MRGNGQNNDNHGRWRNPHSISAAQFEAIERAAAANGVELEHASADPKSPGGPPLYIWQKDHILVSPEVNLSNDDLRRLGAVPAPVENGREAVELNDAVRLLRLNNPPASGAFAATTRQVVQRLNATEELGGKVFVNNLMYVTHWDGANLCPASEPVPLRAYPHTIPYPPPSPGNAGEGVRIVVIDTGLPEGWRDNHPWLYDASDPTAAGVEVDGLPEETYADGNIASHAGHGMFIAGLIRCVAPRARVKVLNTMRWAGSMSEAGVALEILKVLEQEQPDIISLSAGFMIHDAAPGGGPSAMVNVMEWLARKDCRTVLVAATGNDGHGPLDHGMFYPAAFAANKDADYVSEGLLVAVGALRQDRLGRACFSNYDDWVTVYEDGENLINAFPTGRYVYNEPLCGTVPPRCGYYPNDHHAEMLEDGCTCLAAPAKGSVALFDGMAMWSGTSFATPIVAGRIARHMTENPRFEGRPRAATQDLLKQLVSISDAGDGTKLPVFPQPAIP